MEFQLPGRGRQVIWTLDITESLDADIYRLKTQAHDSSDTAAEWNQPDVTARSIPVGCNDWLDCYVVAFLEVVIHEVLEGHGIHVISEEQLEAARAYLRIRFPAMAGAPLLESRVCQYENSTDHNFIFDRHPEAENVWIVGGGSGHGFKHGPVMGEMVRDAVLGLKAPPVEMGLGRLLKMGSG